MKKLRIIIDPTDVEAMMITDYLQPRLYKLGIECVLESVIERKSEIQQLRSRFQAKPANAVLSFSMGYKSGGKEPPIYWILSELDKSTFDNDKLVLADQLHTRGVFFAANTKIHAQLKSYVKSIKVVRPPPFFVREMLPGPYRDHVVIQCDQNSIEYLTDLGRYFSPVIPGQRITAYLKGLAKTDLAGIKKTLRTTSIDFQLIATDDSFRAYLHDSRCVVGLGLRSSEQNELADIAAAYLRPILYCGGSPTKPISGFYDGASGFDCKTIHELAMTLQAIFSGRIDQKRLGANAFRLMFESRRPEIDIMELVK